MTKKLFIGWDIDDTLLVPAIATGGKQDTPNYENIAIYRWFQAQGHYMIIWSGGGIDYARMWADKLGLNPDQILIKGDHFDRFNNKIVDIAFDDMDVDLGKVNIQVKRINNSITRTKSEERRINNQ